MKNILIIKTGALGDVLRTTVILEGLREKYVGAKIYWLTKKSSVALLDNNPFIEELYFVSGLVDDIKRRKYDLIISLEEDRVLLQALKGIRFKEWFGIYLDGKEIKYSPRSSPWNDMSLISRFKKQVADSLKKSNMLSYPELLYRMLGLKWKKQRYKLYLTKKNLQYASLLKKSITDSKNIIGVVSSAGERWPMKSLPAERLISMIKLMKRKIKDKEEILLLTGPSEFELKQANSIKKACPYIKMHDVKDIDEFIGIVNLCDVLIAPDTLSMHIGIALSKYVLAYFTVTSADEIEIYSGKKIIVNHPDYCSYIKENKKRPNITDSVDIEEIVSAVAKLID